MAKDFNDLLRLAKEKGPKRISVAVAEDHDVLLAIKNAVGEEIVIPTLVGNREKIKQIAMEIDFNIEGIEIIHEADGVQASRIATELVSCGKAQVLMKGLIDTSVIMKQVLDGDIGLRTGKVISHVAVFDVPTYHKVFIVTDAAMNIAPSLYEKKEIIENAVELALALDISNPKVAVLAAKEKVSTKWRLLFMQENYPI